MRRRDQGVKKVLLGSFCSPFSFQTFCLGRKLRLGKRWEPLLVPKKDGAELRWNGSYSPQRRGEKKFMIEVGSDRQKRIWRYRQAGSRSVCACTFKMLKKKSSSKMTTKSSEKDWKRARTTKRKGRRYEITSILSFPCLSRIYRKELT